MAKIKTAQERIEETRKKLEEQRKAAAQKVAAAQQKISTVKSTVSKPKAAGNKPAAAAVSPEAAAKLDSFKASIKNTLTPNRNYDSTLTPEKINSDPRVPELFAIYNGTGKAKRATDYADVADLLRDVQSSVNYRSKQGLDTTYTPGDKLFGFNEGSNAQINKDWINKFLSEGSEEDIYGVIDKWRAKADGITDKNSDSKKRILADIKTLEEYAEKNFASYSHRKMNNAASQMAAINAQLRKLNSSEGQMNLLEQTMSTSYDPVFSIRNSPELRQLLDYDELEKQYAGDEGGLYEAVIMRASDMLSGNTAAETQAKRSSLLAERDALNEEREKYNQQMNDILTADNYGKLLADAGLIAKGQNADVQPYSYNYDPNGALYLGSIPEYERPSLAQIIADPDGTMAEYEKAVGAGAAAGMDVFADLARHLEPGERDALLGIYENEGDAGLQKAWENYVENELMKRNTEEEIAKAQKLAVDGPLGAIAAAGMTFGTNVLGAVGGFANAMRGEGEIPDQMSAITEAIRNTQAQAIAEKTPGLNIAGVNIPSLLYQGVMSAGDMATAGAIAGPYAQYLQGGSAFSNQYYDTLERTGDKNLALAEALAAFGLEAGTENISWGALEKVGDLSTAAGKLKYLGSNALTNAGEEMLSSAGGYAASALLEGREAEVMQRYQYLVDNGYTTKEAAQMVLGDIAREIGSEGLIGGLVGGGVAGANVGIETINQNAEYRSLGQQIKEQGNVAQVLNAALESNDDGLKKVAQRLMKKLNTTDPNADVLPDDSETNAELNYVAQGVAEEAAKPKKTLQVEENENTSEPTTIVKPRAEAETRPQKQLQVEENENTGEPTTIVKPRTDAGARPQKTLQVEENTEAGEAVTISKPLTKAEQQPAKQLRVEQIDASAGEGATVKKELPKTDKEKTDAVVESFKGSTTKLGKLYEGVMKALDVEIRSRSLEDVSAALKARLKQLGETQIDEVTDAIAAIALGKEVTEEQKGLVQAASIRKGVLNDLTAALAYRSNVNNWAANAISQETENTRNKQLELAQATRRRVMMPEASTAPAARAPESASVEPVRVAENGETSITTDEGDVVTADIVRFEGGDGGMQAVVSTESGEKSVPVAQVMASDEGQATLITRAAMIGSAEGATAMIKNYDGKQDVGRYVNGFEAAYNYASAGVSEEIARKSGMTTDLSEAQLNAAYTAGAAAVPMPTRADTSGGKVSYASGLGDRLNTLTPRQRAGIEAVKRIAEVGAVNIEFFESQADESGSFMGYENGSYDPATNTIYIDVNAGKNYVGDVAEYAMLRTAAHELTHYIRSQNPDGYKSLADYAVEFLTKDGSSTFDELVATKMNRNVELSYADAVEEVIADGSEMMLKDSTAIQQLAEKNMSLFKRIRRWITNFVRSVKKAFEGVSANSREARLLETATELQKRWDDALVGAMERVKSAAEQLHLSSDVQKRIDNDEAVTGEVEVKHSIRSDERFGNMATDINKTNGYVPAAVLKQAIKDRQTIRDIFLDPANKELLKLPPDIEGNTFVSDASYGGTEENTTVCIRSMAAQALMDLISQNLGRPLTVQDTLLISQEIAGLTDRPECYYCYVATDRRAYRDFLGQYLQQRDAVIAKYKGGADKAELYTEFLGGRKSTANMKARFNMWLNAVDNGAALIDGNDLASLDSLFREVDGLSEQILAAASDASGVDTSKLNIVNGSVRYAKSGKQVTATTLNQLLKSNPSMSDTINRYMQLTDATAYAQSASWAKKMKGYAAYDGHILNWTQKRVDDLNKHYGLRMYSFSDFSPAFILENMQMVTDASVRGLNMLGYTKEMDFAEIFAPSGMNINISTFAYEQGGDIREDYKQGASWERAKALRDKHPNVGIVMVATSDNILEWALGQDWVDVVIPYHLVRTGTDVAEYFGYKNYTSVSADGKGLSFADINKGKSKKERVTSVSPVEHRNDLISYVDALERYGLTPRFGKWLNGLDEYLAGDISPKQFRQMNPNYMKLVNETRRSYADTSPVQPKFDMKAAEESIQQMIRDGGYYTPVGGSVEAEFEIAGEVADKIRSGRKYSQRDAAYQEAYDAGDDYRARQIIHEAALAAGYDAMKLYHGTRSFGFTRVDPAKSDDGISFFVTNDDLVAQTYAGEGADVRRLSTGGTTMTFDKLMAADAETLLELLQKHVNPMYELVGNDELRELLEDEGVMIRRKLIPEAEDLKKEKAFEDENTVKALDAVIDAMDRMSHAKNKDLLQRLYTAYESTLDDFKKIDAAAESVYEWALGYETRNRYYNMQMLLDGPVFMIDNTAQFTVEYTYRTQALEMLMPKLLSGIYELYGRMDNLLDVYANGASWNRLDGSLIGRTGYANTRSFSQYAKENGYNGVYYHDIVDMGGLVNYKASSDVITFFNPEDVKSADPYTYDDDGNLIMPSQRFDRSNTDIRYSKRYVNGEPVVWVQDNILSNKPQGKSDIDMVHDYLMNHINDVYTIIESGQQVYLGDDLPDEYLYSEYSKKMRKNVHSISRAKNRMTPGIGEAIEIATNRRWEKTKHPKAKDAKYGMYRYDSRIAFPVFGTDGVQSGVRAYKVQLLIRNASDKKKYLYDAVNIKGDPKTTSALYFKGSRGPKASPQIGVSNGNSIAQPKPGVKMKSLRTEELSDRELLLNLAGEYAKTDAEKQFLDMYRSKADELNQKQNQLHDIRSDIAKRRIDHKNNPGSATQESRDELIRQQNRANLLAKQIDRLDQELVKIIDTKPMKKVLRDVLEATGKRMREDRRTAVRAVRERNEVTELRHKIRNLADDFNRQMQNPSKRKYIPADIIGAVIKMQELVDTRSGREGKNANEKLASIQQMYARYKSDSQFAYVYDPVIDDMLQKIATAAGNKTIYQMGKAELQDIYNTMKAMRKQVSEAARLKAVKLGGAFGNDATIVDVGQEMYRETMDAAPLAKGRLGDYLNWQLTPDKFFDRLAGHKKGSMWSHVAKSFSDGTEKMLEIQRDFYYHFQKWTESKEFDKLNDTKNLIDIGLEDADGNKVKITRGMMLEVYMHLSSEDNLRGFMYGGFSVPKLKKYYAGKVAEAYGTGSVNTAGTALEMAELREKLNDPNLTESQIAALEQQIDDAEARGMDRIAKMKADIEGKLTAWDRGLIDAVHRWNDGKSRDYINDVTMDLYGIKRASVENYYPIRRDTAFVNTDFESISRNMNLENWGSLKDRVPSKAPILLGDIAYTMDNSLTQMSRYVGYARAQRDFSKLYNVRMPGMAGSVKKIVGTKFGTGERMMGASGAQYIENYIGSITGSRKGEGDFLTVIRRNLPRATMTLNLRVAFSQLSAIPKAAAEVGWDTMASGLAKGGIRAIFSKSAREDLARQNVWFWTRYRGEGGQREFADMKGGTGIIDRAWNWADDKTKGWLLNWCQSFDVMSTVSMWSMAKEWTRKHTRYAEGSAEFKEAANRKYTDILRNTQAANTVSERSDLARNTKPGLSLLTMYKSEAFANFNMLYDAIAKHRKYKDDLAAGKNGVTQADVRNAAKHIAGTATSLLIGASLTNALLKLVINAITGAMNGYRDDEDEVTLESTLVSIGKEVAGDMTGMLVFGGETYDLFSAAVLGDYYYAPGDAALQELANVLETVNNLFNKEDATLEDYQKAGGKLAISAANMLGVPANNVKRLVEGIGNQIEDIGNGEFLSFEAGANRYNSTNYRRLYKASISGDVAKYQEVMAELEKAGVGQSDALSGYRGEVKEAYVDGDIDRETARRLLINYGGRSADEAYWDLDKWDYAIENGSSSEYSKYGSLESALVSGNRSEISAAVKEHLSNGTKADSVGKQIIAVYNDGSATTLTTLEAYFEVKYADDEFGKLLIATVKGNDPSKAIADLLASGKTYKQIMSALNKAFGKSTDRYAKMAELNPQEAKRLEDRVLNAYEALGMDREEERAWMRENWTY